MIYCLVFPCLRYRHLLRKHLYSFSLSSIWVPLQRRLSWNRLGSRKKHCTVDRQTPREGDEAQSEGRGRGEHLQTGTYFYSKAQQLLWFSGIKFVTQSNICQYLSLFNCQTPGAMTTDSTNIRKQIYVTHCWVHADTCPCRLTDLNIHKTSIHNEIFEEVLPLVCHVFGFRIQGRYGISQVGLNFTQVDRFPSSFQ